MTPAPTDRARRRLLATAAGLLAPGFAGCPAMGTPVDDGGDGYANW